MPEYFPREISQAIFRTLSYSDIFDYPLTAPEIHHYLAGVKATYEDVCYTLHKDLRFTKTDKYFTLAGRQNIVSLREQREMHSKKLLPSAFRYGRMMGSLPFVRMVALTGSLAVMNVSKQMDFDYLLVTLPGRLWTARAFVLLLGRLTKLVGHTICPNLILSEDSLAWHSHDLYSARELCQMIPITGMEIYHKLMQANAWAKDFLPNALPETDGLPLKKHAPTGQSFLEFPLRGELGNRLEQWEMNRKIARFSSQEGFGEETIFTAQMCQGNFDHHKRWVQEALEKRLMEFEKVVADTVEVSVT